jgi:glutathione S-transferase
MKLYFSPGACSLAPHILLREVGAKFDLEQVDNRAKKTKSGADFWQISPKGYVPVLELDNGERLTENPAVLQYIGDQFPNSGVLPPCGSMDRYRVQEWLNFVTSEVHKTFSSLFKPDTPEEYKAIAKGNLGKRYAYLDQHFATHQYLHGDKLGVADIYLFVISNWLKRFNIDMAQWPNVKAWWDRIAARPKVQEAMEAEGLKQAA